MEKKIVRLLPARNVPFEGLRTQSPLLMHPGESPIAPFIFLNHHGPQHFPEHNQGLPFGPHPHRGIETVTFVLDGDIRHKDSNGNDSTIRKGGIQWMTAGRGLIHEEVSSEQFKQEGGPLEILQLWINLPAKDKMIPATYTGLQVENMPEITVAEGKGRLHLIAGQFMGQVGPVKTVNAPFMSYVKLDTSADFSLDIPTGRVVFCYLVNGEINIGGQTIPTMNLVIPDMEGDSLRIRAHANSVILLGHAEALREPVVAMGPFVMNTEEEIRQAYDDFRNNRF